MKKAIPFLGVGVLGLVIGLFTMHLIMKSKAKKTALENYYKESSTTDYEEADGRYVNTDSTKQEPIV